MTRPGPTDLPPSAPPDRVALYRAALQQAFAEMPSVTGRSMAEHLAATESVRGARAYLWGWVAARVDAILGLPSLYHP